MIYQQCMRFHFENMADHISWHVRRIMSWADLSRDLSGVPPPSTARIRRLSPTTRSKVTCVSRTRISVQRTLVRARSRSWQKYVHRLTARTHNNTSTPTYRSRHSYPASIPPGLAPYASIRCSAFRDVVSNALQRQVDLYSSSGQD